MDSGDRVDSAAPRLQIDLFGGFVLRVHGRRITDLATRKAEALLIYLACNPQPHQRETLAELLWDDLPPERAAGNLRLTLNQLRKHVAPFLDVNRQTIAIRQDGNYWLDVQAFAGAVATAPNDLATIAQALALYRGDFLQGFHLRDARGFSEWQATQAEHWRHQALIWMRKLVEHHTAHSDYAEAIAWASRVLALDLLDEAAHRQMMLLFARSGQRAAAVRQYRSCQQIMRQELDLDPEPATEALYQRICRMPAQRPHTLPPCTRTLLGRSSELARVYSWLAAPTSRLMSIVGAGGSGKTHLALSVGWRVVTEYLGPCSDGVFYIPLIVHDGATAQVDDGGVLVAIAEALQIPPSGRSTLLERVIRHSSDKEALLIIDNGELLDPSARLALSALIQHTPALRILVPSRERLKLRDESVLDLSGLDHPMFPARIVSPQQEARFCAGLPEYASVQLFLECARQVQGTGDLSAYDHQDQLAIGKICQIVHGLPLAIELVTPWLRLRSPAEIVPEIMQAIDLLVVDLPELPERHRSMRAVFEYSWRLIPARERIALASLSVFPASFTADAAHAIADVSLSQLAVLRDTSLIQCIASDCGTRYALHPLLRHLAGEKLQSDASAAATISARHARYFAAFAAQYEDHLRSAQGPASLKTLEREIDNLRGGWQWAVAACDLAMLGQYCIPLHDFCAIRSWELEGRHLFRLASKAIRARTFDEETPEADLLAAARVLSCYAELEYILGELDAAEEALQHSRSILALQAIEDAPELMFIYKQLGLIGYSRGAYTDAQHYLRLTLQMAEACADEHKCADTLLAIGGVAFAQGDWSDAQQVLMRGLRIYQAKDYHWGIGHSLRFLGMIAMAQGDHVAARCYYQESLALAQRIGNRIGEALVWDQLGLLYLAEAQVELSAQAFQQALAIFQDIGVDVGSGRVLCHMTRLAIAQGDDQMAQQHVLQAMQIAQRVQAPPVLIETLATVLHLWLHLDLRIEAVVPFRLLRALQRHPACAADTQHYIAGIRSEHAMALAYGADDGTQPWPLARIEAIVTAWIADLCQPWQLQ